MPVKPVRSTNDTPDASPSIATVLAPLLALIEPLLERIMTRTLAEQLGEQHRRRLLTDRELAVEVLGCSSETLTRRLLPEGLPYVLVGDARRYDVDEVVAWLRARR
jgi:hypothetical protein